MPSEHCDAMLPFNESYVDLSDIQIYKDTVQWPLLIYTNTE